MAAYQAVLSRHSGVVAFSMGNRHRWLLRVQVCRSTLAACKNPLPFGDWRGNAEIAECLQHDWVDWIGGLPFEVAKPEEIVELLRKQGFILESMKTVGNGWGCNEYVFSRQKTESSIFLSLVRGLLRLRERALADPR